MNLKPTALSVVVSNEKSQILKSIFQMIYEWLTFSPYGIRCSFSFRDPNISAYQIPITLVIVNKKIHWIYHPGKKLVPSDSGILT